MVAPRNVGSFATGGRTGALFMVRSVARIFAAGAIGLALIAIAHSQSGKREAVDVELVIAVDVSYSMDPDGQALQREGYVGAISSRDFIDTVRKGPHGRSGG